MLNVIKPALKMLETTEKLDETHRFFIVLMKYAEVSQFYCTSTSLH